MTTGTRRDARADLVVVGRFPPPRDGQTLATERLAELLAGRYRVVRFNTEPDDLDLVAAQTRLRWRRVFHFAGQRSELRSLLSRHPGAPVLWTSISPTLLGHFRDVLAVLPAIEPGRPVAAVSHRSTLGDRFRDPLTRFTMARLAGRVDLFVFLTTSISDSMGAWIAPPKRRVVPNTISASLCPTEDELREARGRSTGGVLELLFLSNMLPEKGWMDVLEALPFLRERGVPFRMRFAGRWVDPRHERAFDAFVRSHGLTGHVDYLGGVADPIEVRDLYRTSDVFLLPTWHPTEALPLVVLEAFAWGLPVVSTVQGGLKDVVKDGETGFVVPGRNPVAIADAVTSLSAGATWRRASEGARTVFLRDYAPERVQSEWFRLADSLLAG